MSWETLKRAVDLLARSDQPSLVMNFFGGEPLLEFELIRMAVVYAESVLPRQAVCQFGLCTNGKLLDGEKLEFLDSRGIDVQLSFDGLAQAQDDRAPGSFATLDALLDRMRHDHPALFRDRLSIAITLTGRNLPFLSESVAYFLAKRVPEIGITPVVTHDADWHEGKLRELDLQWARVHRNSLAHYRETGRIPVTALRRSARPASASNGDGPTCSAGKGQVLTVDVDGSVWSCVLFCGSYRQQGPELLEQQTDRLGLGGIDDPGLGSRLDRFPGHARETRLFHRGGEEYSTYGKCRDCNQREGCSVCPVSITHIPGNQDPLRMPDLQCAFQKTLGKWRDRFPAQPSVNDLVSGNETMPAGVERLLSVVEGARTLRG
jgi:sulfatase maturation enzyme AslB (radical SAM superfamily)